MLKTKDIYAIKKAIVSGDFEEVKNRVFNYLEPDNKSKLLQLALLYAIEDGDENIVKGLQDLGADVNNVVGLPAIHIAIKEKRMNLVRYFLRNGVDINQRDFLGITPLYTTLIYHNDKITSFLIQMGADVNAGADSDETTPLMIAALWGKKHIVTQLLKAGARTDKIDKNGKTVLDYAIEGEDKEVIKLIRGKK